MSPEQWWNDDWVGNIEKVVKTAPVPHCLTSNPGLRGKESTPNSHSYGHGPE